MKSSMIALASLLPVLFSINTAAQEVNWRRVSNLDLAVAIAVNDSDHIFAATGSGLIRSTDDGDHWTELNVGLGDPRGFSHLIVNSHGYVYASSWQGICRSTNNGESWDIVSQAYDVYGIVSNSSGQLFVAACGGGVLRSTNDGNTWEQVVADLDAHGIVIGPSQELIAASGGRGTRRLRSTDNGDTWQDYGWGFTALAYTSDGTMFAGAGGDGMWGSVGWPYVFRSTDGGESWEPVYEKDVYAVVADTNDQVFAGGSWGGVITSTDHGAHWSDLNVGLAATSVYSLARNSKGVIFAGTEDGIFRCVHPHSIELINSDLYVDPTGQDTNSGIVPSQPLRSLADAMSRIHADSLHRQTIHVANGVYGGATTGESNYLYLRSYVSLVGESRGGVTLTGVQMHIREVAGAAITNMTLDSCSVAIDHCDPLLEHLTSKRSCGVMLYSASGTIREVDVSGTRDEAGILMYGSSPTLCNVTLHHNHGWACGGIRIEEHSSPILVNVTISENSGGDTGGLHSNYGSHPILINSIIWGNSKPDVKLHAFPNANCSATLAYCNLEGGKEKISVVNDEPGVGTIYWLEGNVDADPLFVDEQHGDFRIQQSSPCIDAGVPLFVLQGDTLLNMEPVEYVGLAPDMGALEYRSATVIQAQPAVPQSFSLYPNYPNPFNPSTTIKYELPKSSVVRLSVYDILGREVSVLVNERRDAGVHEVRFDASNLASGVYVYRLTAGDFVQAKKLVILN